MRGGGGGGGKETCFVIVCSAPRGDGGLYSSVVRASEFESEDPGFDPLAGQGDTQFLCPSESTLVPTCFYLLVHGHLPRDFCFSI